MEQGQQHTPEAREKIASALRGRTLPSATREKMREAHRGRTVSSATREKMRAAHLGKPLSAEALARRRSKRPLEGALPADVQRWRWFLGLALRRIRRRCPRNIGKTTIEQLARIIVLVGPVGDPDARRCFYALTALLFSVPRLRTKGVSLARYVAALPQDRALLMRLVYTVEAAQEKFDNFGKARFPVDNVIAFSANIGSLTVARVFIQHCLDDPERYAKTIGAILHPNTFAYKAQRELHGVFYHTAEMWEDHFEQVLEKLRTVR